MTSHDVVSRTRRALGTRKVGHAGTLDPMATGLLLLGVDSSTRLLTYLVGLGKRYTATIRLGHRDRHRRRRGRDHRRPSTPRRHRARTRSTPAIAALTGEISQVPSTFSAIKVDGRRSYDRARAGEEVVLAAAHGHGLALRGARRTPRRGRRSTSMSSSSAPRAPTSGPWPATSAPRSGSAGTSPRCGARRSAAFEVTDAVAARRDRRRRRCAARPRSRGAAVPGGDTGCGAGHRPRARQAGRARASRMRPIVAAVTAEGRLAGLVVGDRRRRAGARQLPDR